MSTFKLIKVDDIHVPTRLRDVEEDHALAIQASVVEHGLLNPITVRSTPNAKKGSKPYTLVAGAHRFRAIELLDDEEIEAIVVEADALEAQLIEIEENVFRNDLSIMDRAVFIQAYRDVWEKKHGKVKRGNPNFSNCANLSQLIQDEAENGFSVHVAERLGLSKRSIERASRIAKNLPADFREKLRGTPIADNQSALLKVARLEPAKRQAAAEIFDIAEGDFDKMYELLVDRPKVKPGKLQKTKEELINKLGAMAQKDRRSALQVLLKQFSKDFDWALSHPLSAHPSLAHPVPAHPLKDTK